MEQLGHPLLGVLPGAAGAGVIVVGVLVLVGWAVGVPVLTSVVPGLVPMNPATAVAFMLAGLSLLCLRRADGCPRGRQPGPRSLQLLRVARPARAAAGDRRLRPHPRRGSRRAARCRGPT